MPERLKSVSALLQLFDEVRRPLASNEPPEPSEDLQLLKCGLISTEQYFHRRIEVSLSKLAPYLDAEDLNYVRLACFEYLQDDLMHSGLFRKMHSRLRNPVQSGHTPREGALVNQNDNTAKKNESNLGSEDLQALKRGELTVEEYLERRLERQIELLNVERLLTEEERDKMRLIIRENFLQSPLFRHYTDAMTGKSETPVK